jgi:peptidoglycan pentaglycine glycine transferase (the first glycine)
MVSLIKTDTDPVQIPSREFNGRVASGYCSDEVEDAAWDAFLQSTPLGHFQQSSLWGRAKRIEGWHPIRMVLKLDGQIAGGFQILCRRTRFGQIGYIYKGPVMAFDSPALIDFLCELVMRAIKDQDLFALIIQPPDEFTGDSPFLTRRGFLANHVVEVISATFLLDLTRGIDEIFRRMRKSTRNEIRQAQRRGIEVREGDEQDIGTFFRLMLATCERQETEPAPATEDVLLEIWKAFRPRNGVRLSIAEYEGRPVAGVFCLCFGGRVTLWKKGWSGEHRDRNPNQLLIFEAIEWSHRNGYKCVDFVSLNPELAVALLRGETPSEDQKKSRDFVHLSYRGTPMMLSESKIYIANPVARFAYQTAMASALSRALAKRLVRIG